MAQDLISAFEAGMSIKAPWLYEKYLLRVILTMANHDEDHKETSLAFYLAYIFGRTFWQMFFGILFGIYPDICSTILPNILSVKNFGILFGG